MTKKFASPTRIGMATALSAVAIVGVAVSVSDPLGASQPTSESTTASNQALRKPVETTQGKVDPTKPNNGNQGSVLDKLPGETAATCAKVGTQGDLRSGTIAVGNWVTARAQFKQTAATQSQPTINLYVIPTDAQAKSATIQVSQVGTSKAVRTATTKIQQQAENWTYFALSVTVPGPGTWRLTATSGTGKGCFDVTFDK